MPFFPLQLYSATEAGRDARSGNPLRHGRRKARDPLPELQEEFFLSPLQEIDLELIQPLLKIG
jgi:hypothetical protein